MRRSIALLCTIVAPAFAQVPRSWVPIADPVSESLLPSGISRLPVHISGRLGHVFTDSDGTEALQVIGDFALRLGEVGRQELRSRQAVVWLTSRSHESGTFQHLQILLWQDAEVRGAADTITSSPALFVTLDTTGPIHLHVDEVALRASADTRVYQEGNAIREAIAESGLYGPDDVMAFRLLDVSGLGEKASEPKPRPVVQIRSEGTLALSEAEEGRRTLTVTGGVYLARGVPGRSGYLEIRADSVVAFLPAAKDGPDPDDRSEAGLGGSVPRPRRRPNDAARPSPAGGDPARGGVAGLSSGFEEMEVDAAYLEGDVELSQGSTTVRASRLYYDFAADRALMLDAVVRTTLIKRNIPLYVRAREIRQLARNHFAASNAVFTTSEFHTPHYHIGASRIELANLQQDQPSGAASGIAAGSFRVRHVTLNVGGHPILYWPYLYGNVDTSETAIKSVRTGFSDAFGMELETDWHFFNVLGLETPEGFDATLSLDFFSQRGPAVGVDARYQRDRYFGMLRSYVLSDKDQDFLGRERETSSRQGARGRMLLRHRQYLEDDWQLSLELSYISDRGFLEEFFESEFDKEKEQETLLYLKKQQDQWALTALLQYRVLAFVTQTERFGELAYHRIGEPLGRGAIWHSENRVGFVRLRPADQTFREFLRKGATRGSGSTARIDTRQEVSTPIDLGPLRLAPFASVRGSAWDDSPDRGGLGRVFGTYGVRGSMYLWRVRPEVRSELFDLDGVRHVIKPDFTVWAAHTNREASELFPFDETVEEIHEVDGVAVGLRQRWQTKRGAGDNRRTVDFLTLDVEAGVFNDAEGDEITNGFTSFSRPETSISRNYLNSSAIWRLNDRTALVSEMNYDINDGEVDILNLAVAVERPPRFAYVIGYRFIEESNSSLFGFDMNYRLTEKHTLAIREAFDLARGETLDFTVALIRKFPRWFGAISFALDEAEDDFGVSLSIWPEGLQGATLGSSRFSGVGNITRFGGG